MFISKKISNNITNLMIDTDIVSKDKHDVLIYCFEYIFDQIIYTGIFLLLGFFFSNIIVSLLFLLMFYSLRSFGGGVHAPSEQACTIISFAVYIFVLIITPIITYHYSTTWLILFVLSIFIIIILAPIPSPNKPLSKEQSIKMKKQCFVCCIGFTVLFLLFYISGLQLYYGTLSICAILIAISMVLGYLPNNSKQINVVP